MARISIKCPHCGWDFFVADGAKSPTCPGCREPVPMAERTVSVAEKLKKLLAPLAVVVAVGVAGLVAASFFFGGKGGEPEPAASSAGSAVKAGGRRALLEGVAAQPPPSAAGNRDLVARYLGCLNIGVISSEVLRLTGRNEDYEKACRRLDEIELALAGEQGKLSAAGQAEPLRPHLKPRDRILWFDQRSLDPAAPAASGRVLQEWLVTFTPGRFLKCSADRAGSRVEITVFTPDRGTDLLEIAMNYGLLVDPAAIGAPATAGAAAPATAPIPAETAREIQDRFKALPAAYRQFFAPADRARVEEILEKGAGVVEDPAFVKDRILGEALPRFEREWAQVSRRLEELGPDALRVGQGASAEFPTRFKEAQGRIDKLAELVEWCKKSGLAAQREYTAWIIVLKDPLHEKGREEAGLSRTPGAGEPK
jgi:hypothetical protein